MLLKLAATTIQTLAMKFCEFKSLDLPSQVHVICKKGVYLSDRLEDDLFVALYFVHDFYVEVFYRFKSSEIIKILSFHSDVMLQPYLDKIHLGNIFSELAVKT